MTKTLRFIGSGLALAGLLAYTSFAQEPAPVSGLQVSAAPAALGRLSFGAGDLGALILAIGALGTAACGLVDATKAFGGGVSNFGLRGLLQVVGRFAVALDVALGKSEWRRVVRAHWINGRSRGEQKAIVKSLIRLGLKPDNAQELAAAAHVNPKTLESAATKLWAAQPLDPADLEALGRMDASVEAQLDAAFDRADQTYRNVSRLCAGVCSVALALIAAPLVAQGSVRGALVVGLLAVPLAPIAKDLASSLQAAAAALRATK
jgi:hypothetical protein